MSDDAPIRRRPRTRLVDPSWPFLYSVDPATQGLVINVPRARRVPLVEDDVPATPAKAARRWPFNNTGPARPRVKLKVDSLSVFDMFPPAPF